MVRTAAFGAEGAEGVGDGNGSKLKTAQTEDEVAVHYHSPPRLRLLLLRRRHIVVVHPHHHHQHHHHRRRRHHHHHHHHLFVNAVPQASPTSGKIRNIKYIWVVVIISPCEPANSCEAGSKVSTK